MTWSDESDEGDDNDARATGKAMGREREESSDDEQRRDGGGEEIRGRYHRRINARLALAQEPRPAPSRLLYRKLKWDRIPRLRSAVAFSAEATDACWATRQQASCWPGHHSWAM